MLLDISFAIFVTAFAAIVIFGHVLLIKAIWPNALDRHHERHLGTVNSRLFTSRISRQTAARR